MQRAQNTEYPMNIIAYSLAVLNGSLDLNKFAIIMNTKKYLVKRNIQRKLIDKNECAELNSDVLVPRFPCPSYTYGLLYALLINGEVTVSFKDNPPHILIPKKMGVGLLIKKGIAYVIRETKDEVTLALNPIFRRKIEVLLELVNSI